MYDDLSSFSVINTGCIGYCIGIVLLLTLFFSCGICNHYIFIVIVFHVHFRVEDILLSYGNHELFTYLKDAMDSPYLHGDTNAQLFQTLLDEGMLDPVQEENLFTPVQGMSTIAQEMAEQFSRQHIRSVSTIVCAVRGVRGVRGVRAVRVVRGVRGVCGIRGVCGVRGFFAVRGVCEKCGLSSIKLTFERSENYSEILA